MYYHYFAGLLLLSLMSGCGQQGPLYLPDQPAPIHVEKDQDKK
jgi:predicted small lipoprotein YifL